jgi:hypothetical protein
MGSGGSSAAYPDMTAMPSRYSDKYVKPVRVSSKVKSKGESRNAGGSGRYVSCEFGGEVGGQIAVM